MIRGLYSAATGLNAMSLQQDVSARNVSNSSKPGYLRQIAQFERYGPQHDILGTSPSVHIDFTPGPVVHTGNRLDMSINGPGFFALEGPMGTMYSRAGVFERNSAGQIVTFEGYALLGQDGQPIVVPPDVGDINVLDDGQVLADNIAVGRVQVVDFDNPDELLRVGTSLFQVIPDSGVTPRQIPTELRPGYREMSNASHITEMVGMITSYRHFEAAQRALRSLGDTLALRTRPDR